MVLFFPMNLIGGSLSQNFLRKAVESKEQGTLGRLVEHPEQPRALAHYRHGDLRDPRALDDRRRVGDHR